MIMVSILGAIGLVMVGTYIGVRVLFWLLYVVHITSNPVEPFWMILTGLLIVILLMVLINCPPHWFVRWVNGKSQKSEISEDVLKGK